MNKRLGFILVALLIVPMLLTGCNSDSPDTAEEYMNAVLEGKVEEAQALACDEAFAAKTAELVAAYAGQFADMQIDPDEIDLKYDMGKGGNEKEVIVTGSITYVLAAPSDEAEGEEAAEASEAGVALTDIEVEYEFSNEEGTLIVLMMDKDGDDWCVSGDSTFGKIADAAEAAE